MKEKRSTAYYFKKNTLAKDGEDNLIAQAVPYVTADEEAVIDRMSYKGTALTRVELVGFLVLFKEALISLLAEGTAIKIGKFFSIRPTISGVFEKEKRATADVRRGYNLRMRASSAFIDAVLSLTTLERIEGPNRQPAIETVYDLNSGKVNVQLTLNGTVKLQGKNLSFDKEAIDEGIYLYDSRGVRALKINYRDKMSDRELSFVLPGKALELGDELYIEVRTRLGSKIMRQTRAAFLLSIDTAEESFEIIDPEGVATSSPATQ